MAGGGTWPWRRSRIRRRRVASTLGGHGGRNDDDSAKKPANRSSGEWICVRGHRIRLVGRMRVDANGDVYVPDSDEEEPGVEVKAGGVEVPSSGGALIAADGMLVDVAGVPANTMAIGDGPKGDGVDVAADGVPADAEVGAEGCAADGNKVAPHVSVSEEIHPEVAARLKMLFPDMDPASLDVFISMYKVMVPAFFKP